jgi:hypothetical protein
MARTRSQAGSPSGALARLALLALLVAAARPAAAIEKLAYDGDPAPTTGGVYAFDTGSVQAYPSPARMDAEGRVYFSTPVAGGSVARGIFRSAGSTTQALVRTGDPAPDTGGGSFAAFSPLPGTVGAPLAVSGDGELVFYAQVSGGAAPSGVFATDGVTTRAVALEGGPAPGGGTWTSGPQPLAINRAGQVLLGASLDGALGLYVHAGSSVTAVAVTGGSAPGSGGGTYRINLPFADLNDAGDAVFVSKLDGGSSDAGLFLYAGGSVSALALEGDPAPGIPGAGFRCLPDAYCNLPCSSDFTHPAFGWPVLNEEGVVAVQGFAETGPGCLELADGIFLASGGTISPVAVRGGPAPAGLGSFRDFRVFSRLDLNRRAELAFAAVTEGATLEHGLFVRRAGGIEVVALARGVAPGTGGAAFDGFGISPTLDASGTRFAEIASTWDGQDLACGLFAFSAPAAVPALSGPARLAGGVALAGAACAVLWRRRRRRRP